MTRDNLIRFIRNTLPMPLSKAQELVEKFQPGDIAKNQFLLKEGAVARESHYLQSGLMRAYTFDLEGNDVTTAFFSGTNSSTDIFSFFKQVHSRENIQALTDCQTWYITYTDMQESFHTIPEFREFGRLMLINNYGPAPACREVGK